jgi:DNA-directed RNA polymerase specialized sigma subunit
MDGKEAGRIRAFMVTLNRTERLILLLFYADQLSQTEISLVLDLPESRVSTMLGTLKQQAVEALHHDISFGSLPGASVAMS